MNAKSSQRVALITGSSRGIGLASAAEFLKGGYKVVVFCRHEACLNDAKELLSEMGPSENLLAVVGDVANPEDVKRIVKETMGKFGSIDVLMNNAGIAIWKPFEETTTEEFDQVMATNVKGAFLFTKEVLPIMTKQKSGLILNVASNLGLKGRANYSAYSPSKFAVIGLTQVTAAEVGDLGIRAYSLLPGSVATKLHLDIHPWEDPDSMLPTDEVAQWVFSIIDTEKESGSSLSIN